MSSADASVYVLAVQLKDSHVVKQIPGCIFVRRTHAIAAADDLAADPPENIQAIFVLACRTIDAPGDVCYHKSIKVQV